MKDDLAAILKSIRNTQANIMTRLEKLERGQDVLGAVGPSIPTGWGYSSPTSPPSKKLAVRKGYAWTYDSVLFNVAYCTEWRQFQLELPVSAFTNAYYYRYVVAQIDLDLSIPNAFDVYEDVVDYPTYEECVAAFEDDATSGMVFTYSWGDPMFPLCVIAVRNNGTTGSTNEYLPITLVDRTQSSFIMHDFRPWLVVTRVQ